jgi:hypothetical protein
VSKQTTTKRTLLAIAAEDELAIDLGGQGIGGAHADLVQELQRLHALRPAHAGKEACSLAEQAALRCLRLTLYDEGGSRFLDPHLVQGHGLKPSSAIARRLETRRCETLRHHFRGALVTR